MVEFGERIYNLRKKSGLSQEEFADKLGVSRQAVSKWETGQSVPDSEKAAAIGAFFGVSLDWLINGVDAPSTAQEEPLCVEPVVAVEEQPAEQAPVKKKFGVGKALLISGIITLAFIGACALATFISMLVIMKAADLSDPETFYMLVMIVPGWSAIFIIAFVVSVIVIRKKQKKKKK